MENKCSKYEGLFIFSDKETLEKHIAECEECRQEAKKMEKVSGLIDEVKFHYLAKNKKKSNMKAACAVIFLLFSTFTYGFISNDDELMDTLRYGQSLSAEDLGFPVDSYGLLMVDEWTSKK